MTMLTIMTVKEQQGKKEFAIVDSISTTDIHLGYPNFSSYWHTAIVPQQYPTAPSMSGPREILLSTAGDAF